MKMAENENMIDQEEGLIRQFNTSRTQIKK